MSEGQQTPRQPHLPSACLTKIFLLLSPRDVVRASCVNHLWQDTSTADIVWEPLCLRVFLLQAAKAPSGTVCPSFFAAYRAWRTDPMASKYESLVPRTLEAVERIKKWLLVHMPEVAHSMRPGVSEEELKEAEQYLGGKPFPPALRVLYRICNGQDTPYDTAFERSRGLQLENHESRFHGLFGGYSFYSHKISTRMHPLFRMCRMTQFARTTGLLPQGFDSVLMAASFNFRKLFAVHLDNAGIYVNTKSVEASFLPAAPASTGTDDGMLRWLENYADSLEQGHYEVGPTVPDEPASSTGVLLFPLKPPTMQVAVTRGVKVEATCILVPEESLAPDGVPCSYMFTYSIRFSLLNLDEQEALLDSQHSKGQPAKSAGPLSTCQLKSRSWTIFDGRRKSEVSGAGVVGQHPLLAAGGAAFAYQSCTEQPHTVGWMEGTFTFVEGSISVPTGPTFDVVCPRFYLRPPDYIR